MDMALDHQRMKKNHNKKKAKARRRRWPGIEIECGDDVGGIAVPEVSLSADNGFVMKIGECDHRFLLHLLRLLFLCHHGHHGHQKT